MSMITLINKRQSCRKFTGETVIEESLAQIAEAARLAPSACNGQPWHFFVVSEPMLREKMANHLQTFNKKAGAFIVIVEEKAVIPVAAANMFKHQNLTQVDIGIAAAHIALVATDLGIDNCILGWFSERPIKQILGIPKRKRIRLIVALGHASDKTLRAKKRKPIETVTTFIK